MSFDFTGKNVCVAGGTSGIDLGIAKAFAAAGASVFIFSRDNDKVTKAVEELSRCGGGLNMDATRLDAVL
ncbi:MAG: SDR family NAD(P)-dependent oxidoreductase [Pseudomonas marincola]